MRWFELTAGSSGFLPYALFALAEEPRCEDRDIAHAYAAYFPWTDWPSRCSTAMWTSVRMLLCSNHSYISHYDDDELAIRRLREIVDRTLRGANGLRNGHRHAVIAGSWLPCTCPGTALRHPRCAQGRGRSPARAAAHAIVAATSSCLACRVSAPAACGTGTTEVAGLSRRALPRLAATPGCADIPILAVAVCVPRAVRQKIR